MTENYNIGSDTTLTIIVNGGLLVHQILTSFEARQITTKLKSTAITGVNRYRELPEGWEGTLEYDRGDSQLDDFFAAAEAGRYAGLPPPVITITETTSDPNTGIPAKYRFTEVALKLETIGARSGDKKVEEKISWTASRRKKVL